MLIYYEKIVYSPCIYATFDCQRVHYSSETLFPFLV